MLDDILLFSVVVEVVGSVAGVTLLKTPAFPDKPMEAVTEENDVVP